jgi:hypothetical protein
MGQVGAILNGRKPQLRTECLQLIGTGRRTKEKSIARFMQKLVQTKVAASFFRPNLAKCIYKPDTSMKQQSRCQNQTLERATGQSGVNQSGNIFLISPNALYLDLPFTSLH